MRMNEGQRKAVIAALAERLHQRKSWCGETHLQKAIYLLQELAGVEFGFDFILYKHGSFSFDLRGELAEMRADGIMQLEPRPYPYGPTLLVPEEEATRLRQRFPRTLRANESQLDFVADWLGDMGAPRLEQLSTAFFVTRQLPGRTVEERATELISLKPHVTRDAARWAVSEVDKKTEKAPHTLAR